MQVDVFARFKFNYLTGLSLIILFTRISLIVDTTKPVNPTPNRQICTKLQSMLSLGKYHTYQMSSNITYVSHVFAQNFLAYSPLDDLFVFVEPKHQLHVYNTQTVGLIVNLITTDVVFATSCISLSSDDRHDLYFIYETRLESNFVSLRICQVHFNRFKLIFENKNCIETITISGGKPDIRIYGFAIKRDHAGTTKSIVFISTDIGLIYTIIDTHTGALTREVMIMNDTITEGSIVVSSSGTVYYANKQEHTIYELLITRDFRLRYGKIIRSNAIKYPFGLISDECNHLYISTRSMILIMFVEKYTTIRSVFSKASDLPITIERLNSTTYIYATVKKSSGKTSAIWMFNFLYFTDPEKPPTTTQSRVVTTAGKFDVGIQNLSSRSESLLTDETTMYKQTTSPVEKEIPSINKTGISTEFPISEDQMNRSVTQQAQSDPDYSLFSKTSISDNSFQKQGNLSFNEDTSFQNDLMRQSTSNLNLDSEYFKQTTDPSGTRSTNDMVDRYSSLSSVQTDRPIVTINQSTNDRDEDGSTLSSFVSTEYLHSSTVLEEVLMTSPFDITQPNFLSSIRIDDFTNPSSTLAPKDPPISTEQSSVEQFHSTLDNTQPTQPPSTVLDDKITLHGDINNEYNTVQSSSTDAESIYATYNVSDPVTISDDTTTNTVFISTSSDQLNSHTNVEQTYSSSPEVNDMIISSIPHETISLETTSHYDTRDNRYDESGQSTDTLQSPTLSMTLTWAETSDGIVNVIEDKINQKHSSTLNSLSPFVISDTTPIPSHSAHLSSLLHHSSTTLLNLNRLSSLKRFSETTEVTTAPTSWSSSISTPQSSYLFSSVQTTNLVITSDISEQSSITTLSDESSSPLITSHLTSTSTISSVLFTTVDNQYTSIPPTPFFESSPVSYTVYPETSTTEYQSFLTTAVTGTNLDSTPIVLTDESSTFSSITITDEENLPSTDSPLSATTDIIQLPSTLLSSITHNDQTEYTSTQPSFEITSTISLLLHTSKSVPSSFAVTQPLPRSNRPARRRPSHRMTTSTSIASTTTTKRRYRTRKQKTITTSLQYTTSFHDYKFLTSSPTRIRQSNLTSLQQQQILIIKPSSITNASNTLLSNDLLNTLFNTNTSTSVEKFIYFNLMDLPPSSWNLSLETNDSILLDLALPSSSNPSNLTFTKILANRLVTNIVGFPVNLQVEEIYAKQFSLAMNITNNDPEISNKTNSITSDVVIGRVKSEQFELNITKSDNMNIHVQQVDSATAELYFDSEFCTNESSLQINLNLSKNGTIRYGNRTPIRIGSVFTRVHMLKQSCNREQPFTLFFDICQRQNPCSNGGTCRSVMPNYDDPSYSPDESSEINYQCICPVHILGEHCQYSQYPFGYCINGGTLIQTFDSNNISNDQCLCLNGFHGHHCEENVDNCININCSRRGICRDGTDTYTCSCFSGFFGHHCEQSTVETVLYQVASKSFAIVAILLIAGIAGLFVASDIHTYLTRKKQKKNHVVNRIPRATSELFENSVLLLGFGEAPVEMSDLSTVSRRKKATTIKQRPSNIRKSTSYKQVSKRKPEKRSHKQSSRHYLLTEQSYDTMM